jgi:hypothetical protein
MEQNSADWNEYDAASLRLGGMTVFIGSIGFDLAPKSNIFTDFI